MEKPISLQIEDAQLLAIVHQPESPAEVGVLLIVGGPQYRAGSHRQFVQLSRALYRSGIASMRFDYRGMGDSEGNKKPFDDICADIRAACDAFCHETGLSRIVLWGLCDAASAAMIYAHNDRRVEGLLLLNPWLRSEASMGKTMVRHYYMKRLLSWSFWRKLIGGKVKITKSLQDAKGFVQAGMSNTDQQVGSYQDRMRLGINNFGGRICLVLSGSDLTAREFEQQALDSLDWPAFQKTGVEVHRINQADHTFSSKAYKHQVEELTRRFVESV